MDIQLVRLIEELAANAWPAEIIQHVGGWRLRYSGGDSRRVNSVLPNQLPGPDGLEHALAISEAFYLNKAAPPLFQICPAAMPENLPAILETRGYLPFAHTAVQISQARTILSNVRQPDCLVTHSNALTEGWFQTYVTASGYSQASLPVRRGILSRIEAPTNYVMLSENDKPVAAGLGVVERGWMGVFCVVTAPSHRRQGFASGIMHLLANWGKTQGAENLYLQVMEDNTSAQRLYQQIGFKPLYQYCYYQLKDT